LGPLTPSTGGARETNSSSYAHVNGNHGPVNHASSASPAHVAVSTSAEASHEASLGASPARPATAAASTASVTSQQRGSSTSGNQPRRRGNRTVVTPQPPFKLNGGKDPFPSSGTLRQEHPAPTSVHRPSLAPSSSRRDHAPTTSPSAASSGKGRAARAPPPTPSAVRASAATASRTPPASLLPLTTPGQSDVFFNQPSVAGALPLDAATAYNAGREFSSAGVVLFWKPPSCFSNWTPSSFTVLGTRYESGEQYFMSEKARLFGDSSIYSQIMSSSGPHVHKALGRRVRNFDHGVWELRREDIMLTGLYAKFAQNASLREHLLSTRLIPQMLAPRLAGPVTTCLVNR